MPLDSFLRQADKKLGKGAVAKASDRTDLHIKRFSSGSFELDVALGGGIPRGRVTLPYGPPSCGKTTGVIKTCVSAQNTCVLCDLPLFLCKHETPQRGRALIVDHEGTFDIAWAETLGFDSDYHFVIRPSIGEQGIDTISVAVSEHAFDVIILDSIESCMPSKEFERSAAEVDMGSKAKMMNRAFRKWTTILAEGKGPALLTINQPRSSMAMYGPPDTLPGGSGQNFAASVKIRYKSSKVHQASGGKDVFVEMSGTVDKNKTGVPKREFNFGLSIRDHLLDAKDSDSFCWPAGEIDNVASLAKYAKRHGFLTSGGGKWKLTTIWDENPEEIKFKNRSEVYELLHSDKEIQYYVWQTLLEKMR